MAIASRGMGAWKAGARMFGVGWTRCAAIPVPALATGPFPIMLKKDLDWKKFCA